MTIDKPALRAMLRARRDAFVLALPEDSRGLGPPPPRLAALIADARCVAGYIPIGSEADAMPFLSLARSMALPVARSRQAPIRFARWRPGDTLASGPLGLSQPGPEAPDVGPDLILAPLLGFDRGLGRIGQGAGHYDRAFAAHPHAIRVGVAWSVQETDPLPLDPWDVPLHAVVTEREWIER